MEDAPRGLPQPIRIAIGFLIADVLWVVLMLFVLGRHFQTWGSTTFALAPVLAILVWLAFAVGSVVGLLCWSRTALTAAVFLMAASALLVGGPLLMRLVETGSLPLIPQTFILLGGLACFLTPLALLLAGRREFPVLTK